MVAVITHRSTTADVCDIFCGAGGTSTGFAQAGFTIATAINHWARALETHGRNHPNTRHILTDVQLAHPSMWPRAMVLVASPQCTDHSKAKGRIRRNRMQPTLWDCDTPLDLAAERSRCTMWEPQLYAEVHQPEYIVLENVVDVRYWDKYEAWRAEWDRLGYAWRENYINSMFIHPTPQSRNRWYFVAWRKGNPAPDLSLNPPAWCERCAQNVNAVQSWKDPDITWGEYGPDNGQYIYCCPRCARMVIPYYYCAANIIDPTIPGTQIGGRSRPLVPNTMRRIEEGIGLQVDPERYMRRRKNNPFARRDGPQPFLVKIDRSSDVRPLTDPTWSVMAGGNHHGLLSFDPFVVRMYGTQQGNMPPPSPITDPIHTITATGGNQALVSPEPFIISYYGADQPPTPLTEALPTQPANDHHGLVTTNAKDINQIDIDECYFRMLQPLELKRAMGFDDSYIITGNKKEQVEQTGNAVCVPVAKMFAERCMAALGG
jgi:DNA (cytosine-5)-methyltransferase 1